MVGEKYVPLKLKSDDVEIAIENLFIKPRALVFLLQLNVLNDKKKHLI